MRSTSCKIHFETTIKKFLYFFAILLLLFSASSGWARLRVNGEVISIDNIKYHIEVEIGSGGEGSVFRAITEEQVEGRDVLIPIRGKAIKVFSEFSVDDSESMAKFKTVLNSYTALAAVKPALRLKLFPQIYVVTRDSTGVLKAQKWIPDSNVNLTPENMIVVSELGKKSLADWLAKDAGSDPELRIREAHEVFDGILAELVRLARAGFVHGDIKPSNVVLGYDGGVHLVDFGGAAPPLSLPSSRTMGYTAPEIVYAGSPMSVLTDLYSLGATVLKVLDPQIKPQVNYSILGSVQEKLNDIDSQVRSLQKVNLTMEWIFIKGFIEAALTHDSSARAQKLSGLPVLRSLFHSQGISIGSPRTGASGVCRSHLQRHP